MNFNFQKLEAEELVINRNLFFIRNIVKNMILKNDTDDKILVCTCSEQFHFFTYDSF